jgi:hypothetical protein
MQPDPAMQPDPPGAPSPRRRRALAVGSLALGNYIAACRVVNPVSHKPHAESSTLTGFTVAP